MFGLSLTLLETLPGWPEAPDPSVVSTLLVLFGIPFGIGAVIALIVAGPSFVRRSQAGTDVAILDKGDVTN